MDNFTGTGGMGGGCSGCRFCTVQMHKYCTGKIFAFSVVNEYFVAQSFLLMLSHFFTDVLLVLLIVFSSL